MSLLALNFGFQSLMSLDLPACWPRVGGNKLGFQSLRADPSIVDGVPCIADRQSGREPLMPRLKRKQLFVDPVVQGALLWRVVVYFGSWIVAAGVTATTLGMVSFVAKSDYTLVGEYWFFMKLVL